MPTKNKRINLTLPDKVYRKIQDYRDHHGIQSNAAACRQLIVQRLNEEEKDTDVRKTTQYRHHDSTNDYGDGKIDNQARKTDNGTGRETR